MALQDKLFDIHQLACGSEAIDRQKAEINIAMRSLKDYLTEVSELVADASKYPKTELLRPYYVTDDGFTLEFVVKFCSHIYFDNGYNVVLYETKNGYLPIYTPIASSKVTASAERLPAYEVAICHKLVNQLITVMLRACQPDDENREHIEALLAAAPVAS